ncbi:MAG TPA: TonB family protein [Thermoanaerobaculia bacterium]|nr:TonB family protein [Thermoanaerobaculia bacterium]
MFETSVVRTQAQAAKGRFSLLTISFIAHSAVVIGAIAVSIASVDFPTNAPDEFAQAPVFMPVRIPPPLGNPNGGATKPQPAAQPAVTPPQQPNQITAPAVIPPDIPTVDAPSNGPATTTGGDSIGNVPGPIGDPDGDANSVAGDPNALLLPATKQPPVEEKIYEVHEVKAPVLLHRVAPPYPQKLVSTRKKATVVVRCIIDRNGHVRDPQILRPDLPPFNAAVIDAVQQWRYTPGSRNGVAVETYLSVTVVFSVN